MDKYALMKRFHYDLRLQVYMYDFMYVNPETMAEEEYFPYTKYMLQTTIEFQLQENPQSIYFDLFIYVHNIISYI